MPFQFDVILLISLAAALAGAARGFSGFGGALIFIPLVSTIISPKIAAPLLLLTDTALSVGMLPNAWRNADRREVSIMAIGTVVGVPLGTFALSVTPVLTVRWVICAVALLLLAFLMSGWRYDGTPRAHLTVAVGFLAGLFGGAAQMSGPPVVAYWLGGAMPPAIVRANIVLFFAIVSVVSAVTYLVAGLLTTQVLLLACIVAPAYAIGLWLGSRLFGRASEQTFRRICFGLIAAACAIGLPLFDAFR